MSFLKAKCTKFDFGKESWYPHFLDESYAPVYIQQLPAQLLYETAQLTYRCSDQRQRHRVGYRRLGRTAILQPPKSCEMPDAPGWHDSLVVSLLDLLSRDRGSSPAGGRWSRSNRGPVALCTLGLGLLNPPSFRGQ